MAMFSPSLYILKQKKKENLMYTFGLRYSFGSAPNLCFVSETRACTLWCHQRSPAPPPPHRHLAHQRRHVWCVTGEVDGGGGAVGGQAVGSQGGWVAARRQPVSIAQLVRVRGPRLHAARGQRMEGA